MHVSDQEWLHGFRMAARWRRAGFWSYWRIPHVRRFAVEFEMDLQQWMIGFCFGSTGVDVYLGPFELSLVRRCDCCP